MSDGLRVLLVVIVLFGIYRQACVWRFYQARRRARRDRFRGLRLVISNSRPRRSPLSFSGKDCA